MNLVSKAEEKVLSQLVHVVVNATHVLCDSGTVP